MTAVDWLVMNGGMKSRSEAVQAMKTLIDNKLVLPLTSPDFADDANLYQFASPPS